MRSSLLNPRLLRHVLSCNLGYNQWTNHGLCFRSEISIVSRNFCYKNVLPKRYHNKPAKLSKRKWETMVIKNDVRLTELMYKYELLPSTIKITFAELNWVVNDYKSYVFRDKGKLKEFLDKLMIPYIVPEESLSRNEDQPEILKELEKSHWVRRAPIITVMGHVDHGKTTLLDTLRKTSIAKSEDGGITQRIGVFTVPLGKGFATVLDTPGHAAFNTMRQRGAQVTDIIILVVAADDGVMEQTLECIQLATETNTPLIVAINKIDKPGADIELTQQMLSQHGILVEQLSGNVQCVPISALKGTNLDKLMEAIQLQTDVMDLKANPTGPVRGFIIETKFDLHLGKTATVVVQSGVLKTGKLLVSSRSFVKVRTMYNCYGRFVTEAKVSEAVSVSGWKQFPAAGEEVLEVKGLKEANQILKQRAAEEVTSASDEVEEAEEAEVLTEEEETLKDQFSAEAAKISEYNIIIKADSIGSLEAVQKLLTGYTQHNLCSLNVIQSEVGNVTPSDIELAKTFNATIYCFNSIAYKNVAEEIEKNSIPIFVSNVIYRIGEHIKKEVEKRFPAIKEEEAVGQASVLQIFTHGKKPEYIAGCMCEKGSINRDGMYHLMRDGKIIDTGTIKTLKHLKNDVKEIKKDYECGIKFSNTDLKPEVGDTVVCFKIVERIPKCTWNCGV